MVWCGARNGRVVQSARPAPSSPATLCTLVVSSASSSDIAGRMPGRRRASMVLPDPGGPMSRMLCAPAAATSSARFAPACPRTSAKSASSRMAAARYRAGSTAAGASGASPARCRHTSASEPAPSTEIPATTAASGTLGNGTMSAAAPDARAARAMGSAPRIGRRSPSRPSSPATTVRRPLPSSSDAGNCSLAMSTPSAIGRSNAEPCFGTSAGARLTVIRLSGKANPALASAAATRSLPSFTAPCGSPTVLKEGNPLLMSISTSTR